MAFLLTDLGLVSALGCGRDETLRCLIRGEARGMRSIPLSGGDVTVFGFADLPLSNLQVAPTRMAALLDAAVAQLDLDNLYHEVPASRVGAVLGTSNSTMEEFTVLPDKINMAYPAERLREKWGVGGPAWCVSTACSSSGKVFASARRLLDEDRCDAVLVGGVDVYTRTVVEGFHALESLSPTISRPFSRHRDGINLGEGAAVFVMRKGEGPGCRLAGVGESSDAYHLTAPDPSGRGAEVAMCATLADAHLGPRDINFINMHGTGTVYNDDMEIAAVHRVFGNSVCHFSTKPLTGHCLGAAGAIEAALCFLVLSLREAPCRALSNSFAFGGSNVSVILEKA